MKNVFIVSILAASSMYGAVLIPNGVGATWQSFTPPPAYASGTSTIASAGAAYWNNDSSDNPGSGPDCNNVGCLLTGTGGFGLPNTSVPVVYLTGANPAYLGTASGAALDFAIQGVPGGGAEFLAEYASSGTKNWIGWYDQAYFNTLSNTFAAATRGVQWDVIFTGANSTGTPPVVFTPSAQFGLWALANSDTDGTTANLASRLDSKGLFSDTLQNGPSGDPNLGGANPISQHFAIFAQSATAGNQLPVDYFVGFEDLNVGASPLGDKDYQDAVFKLKVVPEPGYYILLSLGLAGLGLRRRMNKTSVN